MLKVAGFASLDSDRAAAFLRVIVEHSRSAEDETKCRRSSQDVSGNPPILCINQAITSRLTQAPGPPLSSRQHAASPFSVSGPFSISVFRSRKFRRSCTVLQLLGRDEGPVSSKREFGFFLEIRFLALIWRLISTSHLRWAAKGRGFSEELNLGVVATWRVRPIFCRRPWERSGVVFTSCPLWEV